MGNRTNVHAKGIISRHYLKSLQMKEDDDICYMTARIFSGQKDARSAIVTRFHDCDLLLVLELIFYFRSLFSSNAMIGWRDDIADITYAHDITLTLSGHSTHAHNTFKQYCGEGEMASHMPATSVPSRIWFCAESEEHHDDLGSERYFLPFLFTFKNF